MAEGDFTVWTEAKLPAKATEDWPQLVSLLRHLADRFPQVILITHIESVRDGFDRVLRLRYDVERGVARVAEESDGGQSAAA